MLSAEEIGLAPVSRFEDLVAWQKARELARHVYATTRAEAFARDYRLAGQLRSSASSILANIAEGFERSRAAEFHQFLSVAKGSCAELRSHLYVALDAGYLLPPEAEDLFGRCQELGRVVGGLRSAVQRRRDGERA